MKGQSNRVSAVIAVHSVASYVHVQGIMRCNGGLILLKHRLFGAAGKKV